MKRHVTQGEWSVWKSDKNLHFTNKVKIMIRAEMPLHVYGSPDNKFKGEILLGYTEIGEMEVLADRSLYVRLHTEGRAWFKTFEVCHPTLRTSDTVYTSLERPSNLSPEMQAIMRMVRKNEIEREQQREQNARIQDDLRRITAANISRQSRAQNEAAAKETKPLQSEDVAGSVSNPSKSKSGEAKPAKAELDEPQRNAD
mgnify:CR=1 FL=1